MYQPPQFQAKDRAHALELMRSYPLASLISTDAHGFPFVTHLPLHLDAPSPAHEHGRLLGHLAKANPHGAYLLARPQALVTFMGPHAYLSPTVYPDLTRVPTWNYLTVHATVRVSLIEEAQAKDHLLKQLIGDHEPAYRQQWRGLAGDYQQKMLAAIVGLEMHIEHLQCTLKLNQHRPESHAKLYASYASGHESERALAAWMRKLGLAT